MAAPTSAHVRKLREIAEAIPKGPARFAAIDRYETARDEFDRSKSAPYDEAHGYDR